MILSVEWVSPWSIHSTDSGREGRIPSVGPTNQTFLQNCTGMLLVELYPVGKEQGIQCVSENRAFSEQETSQVISKFDFGFNNLNA